jgi:hypothetical protein
MIYDSSKYKKVKMLAVRDPKTGALVLPSKIKGDGMKLYLRVVKIDKLTREQEECWHKYGGIGHATYSKELMTFEQICWRYFIQELNENLELQDKGFTSIELLAWTDEMKNFVEEAIGELVKHGFLKEF